MATRSVDSSNPSVESPEPSGLPGWLVVVFIMGAASLVAFFALIHHWQQGRRALDYFGSEAAFAIRHYPEVELLRLNETGPEQDYPVDAEIEPVSGLKIQERHDISEARGLIHFRQALIGDGSYRWPPKNTDTPPAWRWALVVSDPDREDDYTVLIDDSDGHIRGEGKPQPIDCTRIQTGMKKFFEDLGVLED
ncbi:MAG: hypothetical protein WD045_00185 [Pirellulaceae bacterium]